MIRSMTGYGEAEGDSANGRLRVEIRTVNHRHFHPRLRTPSGFEEEEPEIRSWIRERISRGHVNVKVRLADEPDTRDQPLPELDVELARRYRELLRRMKTALDLPGEVTVQEMVRFGDVFRTPDVDRSVDEVDRDALRRVVDRASRAVVAMRESEGRRLQEDLEGRMVALSAELDRIEERAPKRLERERERLRERIAELLESDEVDEERLTREVAYMADKWDISEEIVRFRAHVEHFRELMGEPPEEAAGKRLGFVVQEMHREANTLGAKANDSEISQSVVQIKEEIERLREQVENVE